MSLCLSRKEGQSVVLEIDGAVVAVVTLRRPSGLERPISGVLAIDAGPEVEIQRDERWLRLDGTGATPRPGYRRGSRDQDSQPAPLPDDVRQAAARLMELAALPLEQQKTHVRLWPEIGWDGIVVARYLLANQAGPRPGGEG